MIEIKGNSFVLIIHILTPLRNKRPILWSIIGSYINVLLMLGLSLNLEGLLLLLDQRWQVSVSQYSLDFWIVLVLGLQLLVVS